MSINTHAKYTVVLNELLRHPETKAKIDDILSRYPMYTPKSKNEYIPRIVPTREELNRKILNYYKYREIGFETVGRFLDELETTMFEIMPYYNQLMFTADQDYNIIYNVDYVRTTDTKRDGETSGSVNGDTTSNSKTTASDVANTSTKADDKSTVNSQVNHNSKNVHSETPSNELDITADNIDSVPYADKVTWNKDTNNDSSTTTGESNSITATSSNTTGNADNTSQMHSKTEGKSKDNENTIETTKGNFGVVSAQDLIEKYRGIIINIEQLIINDERLAELFMLVY